MIAIHSSILYVNFLGRKIPFLFNFQLNVLKNRITYYRQNIMVCCDCDGDVFVHLKVLN